MTSSSRWAPAPQLLLDKEFAHLLAGQWVPVPSATMEVM
jgi:hypothetical protein